VVIEVDGGNLFREWRCGGVFARWIISMQLIVKSISLVVLEGHALFDEIVGEGHSSQ
jgi:hypothetical protein